MNIDQSIFKAYDIRGIYPEQLNEDGAYAIARAYATLMQRQNPSRALKIAISADMRISSPSLKTKVIEALTASGIDVEDLGLLSTPTFYWAVAKHGYDGGIQISASHNPKQWNGLKMVRANAIPISKNTGIMEMYRIVSEESYLPLAGTPGKQTSRTNVIEEEVEEYLSMVDIKTIKPCKIIVDTANSMGSLDLEALFKKLPVELVKMNFELDGNFPAHEADPMKDENTLDLRCEVIKQNGDLGITTDGDADRIFFVDEKGNTIPQPILRGLMAQIELKEHPGSTVAYDIRPGKVTKDMIDEAGGKSVVTPVGHSLIKEMMIQENAIFGGESSGHYFYKLQNGTFEAPMLLILKLLSYISQSGKTISEIITPYNRYYNTGEINIKVFDREEANKKIDLVSRIYADGNQALVDGITIEYPDFWFIVRSSNTEPVLRLILEARTEQLMVEKRDEILNLIKA